MRHARIDTLTRGDVAILGVPWDEGSSFARGTAGAPWAIRSALQSASSNLSTESGLELGAEPRLADAGNVDVPEGDAVAAIDAIDRHVSGILAKGAAVLSLGGDHAVTYPIVRAHARVHPNLSILHLDAHSDLYDAFEGNAYSHACPFARIMEAGLASRLVQVGIRTLNDAQRRQARRFGVEIIEMRDWTGVLDVVFETPVYLSLDLDVLDPAFAPGVSHHEPGGFSVRDVLQLIQRARGRIVGADVVELNPIRDGLGLTAAVAAKFVKEIAARLLQPD